MQKIKFSKPYKFAHHGYLTEEFSAGQEVEASDELAECAIADKVAKRVKDKASQEEGEIEVIAPIESTPEETDAAPAAPENSAAKSAPETK